MIKKEPVANSLATGFYLEKREKRGQTPTTLKR